MGKEQITTSDAFIYFVYNGIDPRDVDPIAFRQIDKELKETPCTFNVNVPDAKPGEDIVIPQIPDEGRAREVFDTYFSIMGISPKDEKPEIVANIANTALSFERVYNSRLDGTKVEVVHDPVPGLEYSL